MQRQTSRGRLVGGLFALTGVVTAGIAWHAQAQDAGAEEAGVPSSFVAVAPCRLLDLRPDTQVGPRGTPIRADESYPVRVTGESGECSSVPAGATGVALNVTAVAPTEASFLAVVPGDQAGNPGVSNLNFLAGAPPTPNKVDVGLDGDGRIRLYNAFGEVFVLADVTGYYVGSGVDELSAQLDLLASNPTVDQALLDRLDAIEAELESLASGPMPGEALLDRVAALEFGLDSVRADTEAADIRIGSLEDSRQALQNQDASILAQLSLLGGILDDVRTDVDGLEGSRPFAVFSWNGDGLQLSDDMAPDDPPVVITTVTVHAPVAGVVTLIGGALVEHGAADGADVACGIVEATEVPAQFSDHVMFFESGSIVNEGTLAGVHQFPITAGASVDYVLACHEYTADPDGGYVGEASLAAIFTPNP